MKINRKNIIYILYARKSTESEERQVQSIEDQLRYLKKLASDSGLKILKIYKESKSAKRPDTRTEFAKMLDDIEEGKANGILCWKLDRLSRNPIDSGKLQYLLQEKVIESIKTSDREHLPEDNALLFSVETSMANQSIRDLSKNVKRGMKSKLEKGWYPHLAPIGYLNDKSNNTIIKDPERFDLLRKMWDMLLSGIHTRNQILDIVNNKWGFRTKKYKKMDGVKLTRNSLYGIFINPFYKGSITYNGLSYNLKHPKMITEEEFDSVQVILGLKSKSKPKKHLFAYTGLIRCGECGCLYTAETKKKHIQSTGKVMEYIYYHCTRKKLDINCSQKYSVREDRLEEQIRELLNVFTIKPVFKKWALEKIRRNHKKEVEDRNKIYKTKESTLRKTQKMRDNLLGMKLKEQVTDKEFEEKNNELLNDIAQLRGEIKNNYDRADKWLELTERAFNFTANVKEAFEIGSIEVKKTILMAIGERITIIDGRLDLKLSRWLIPIAEAYPALEKAYKRLEPTKNLASSGFSSLSKPICERWLGREDSNL